MKKFYFFLSIITMLIFQSCTLEHDKLLEEYIKEKPLKVLCKRQYRQDDALNVNITEYTVATVKSVAFIKESEEEN